MELDFKPKVTIWLWIILVLVGFAWAVIYFSKNSPALTDQNQVSLADNVSARKPLLYSVSYDYGVFSPTNIRIHVGDSIKFQNDSTAPVHITSNLTGGIPDLPGFDSVVDIPSGSSFAFTFSKAGTFGYHNAQNTDEAGTVIVRP